MGGASGMTALVAKSDASLARLEEIKADPLAMTVIAQRVAEGERLRDVAKAWQIPYGLLFQWIQADEARWKAYERALAVRADDLVAETVAISDEQAEVVKESGGTFDPDVPRDKLRIDTRLKVAARYDPSRFADGGAGGKGSSGVTVIVDRTCGGRISVATRDAVAVIDSPPALPAQTEQI
jgi:hypothetical protein